MAIALWYLLEGLIALGIAILSAPFGKWLVNWAHSGWTWFDKTIAYLTNKAIDLGIELTKWMAPHVEANLGIIVRWFHHSGENSKYTHGAIKNTAAETNTTFWWMANNYIPARIKANAEAAQATTITKVRTIPLSKAQVLTLEHAIEWDIRKTQAATIPATVPLHWPKLNWSVKKWRAWLGLAAGAGALTLPGTTAWDRTKWKEQDKTNTQTHKRFRTLNWLLAFTGAAALVAAGLAKLGLGWMAKCPNLKISFKGWSAHRNT